MILSIRYYLEDRNYTQARAGVLVSLFGGRGVGGIRVLNIEIATHKVPNLFGRRHRCPATLTAAVA